MIGEKNCPFRLDSIRRKPVAKKQSVLAKPQGHRGNQAHQKICYKGSIVIPPLHTNNASCHVLFITLTGRTENKNKINNRWRVAGGPTSRRSFLPLPASPCIIYAALVIWKLNNKASHPAWNCQPENLVFHLYCIPSFFLPSSLLLLLPRPRPLLLTSTTTSLAGRRAPFLRSNPEVVFLTPFLFEDSLTLFGPHTLWIPPPNHRDTGSARMGSR